MVDKRNPKNPRNSYYFGVEVINECFIKPCLDKIIFKNLVIKHNISQLYS
jgi:hypothetical protein